ncbi:hypothetical protein MTR67_003614, partial [Solanum verrucosum]
MPSDRDIDFCIDFEPGTLPISIPSYRMAPSKEEYVDHLRIVLGVLGRQKLYAKFSKCEFWLDSVAFLRNLVSREGVIVDPQKIEAVKNWVRSSFVIEIRSFVGFAIYYRRFVKNFASIATHLTRLIKKEVPFEWTEKCEESFQKLKTLLTTIPILALPVEVRIDYNAQQLAKYEEEPIAILDHDVQKLRTKEIKSVKVQWKHLPIEEATWETENDMRDRCPQLFDNS